MTTAFLLLRLLLGNDVRYREVPFDQIIDEVQSGPRPTAGLLIHEGQLTYESLSGCTRLWISANGGCSRPASRCHLGVNAARRDLGDDVLQRPVDRAPRLPFAPASTNRTEALAYAGRWARGLS